MNNKIVVGIIVAIIVIIFLAIILYFGIKAYRSSQSTASKFSGGFNSGSKYRGISSYKDVGKFVNFVYQNQILRSMYESGAIDSGDVYTVYKEFYNSGEFECVPEELIKNVKDLLDFMETGRDFRAKSPDMVKVGMAIINIDRSNTEFFNNLPKIVSTRNGSNPAYKKILDDYNKITTVSDGYYKSILANSRITDMASNDKTAALMEEAVKEDVLYQGVYGNGKFLNQIAYDYQDSQDSALAKTGAHRSARDYYSMLNKKFPGIPYKSIITDDEELMPAADDVRDPNIPHYGIMGKVPDVPYTNDIYAGAITRRY
jgi:hypothetical protein